MSARFVSAVVETLEADGINAIILNAEQRNHGAIRVYERLGSITYWAFVVGSAERI
jgi:ribosomal protein S18 acetylase RimI-like enzyme